MDILGTILGDFSLSKKQWYIIDYDDGSEIFSPKSIIELSETRNINVASEPVEQGSFTTYNKSIPAKEIHVTIGLQGKAGTIQGQLDTIENYCVSSLRVNIISPFKEYISFAFADYEYTHNMAGALIVDVKFVEVRETRLQYSQVTTTQVATTQADGEGKTTSDSGEITKEETTESQDVSKVDTGEKTTEEPTEEQESGLRKITGILAGGTEDNGGE